MNSPSDATALAHDIRNILTPALLSTEALAAIPLAGASRHTARIMRAIDKTVALCADTMEMAKAGPNMMRMQSAKVRPVMHDAVELAVPYTNSSLELAVLHTGDKVIVTDRNALMRMVFNLVRNAATAIGDDHGEIRVETKAENGFLRIDVRDTGPGLPNHIVDRLFPSLANAFEKRVGRIGVGLPSTAKTAAELGGRLVLISTGRSGTHFRIGVPYAAAC
ncbi:MAG: HAMP domain-containing sensor histidine kinase [Pseudomonadota bacterium]